ncbi:hypothetical protein [Streptomyces bullii]|uniref:Uncharacterized protein n=1 Tax=Streptomyces bullii TaxID=349910 RepID=A0ABW0USN7_9ACTN
MVTLSLRQLLLLALAAAFCAVLLNRGLVLAWRGLHRLFEHLMDRREACRARREDLQTCRAIDALYTTHHPKEGR